MNLKPIEKKITELERKTNPVMIQVWIVDEENDRYTMGGQNYTRAEWEAMQSDDDTVIIISRTDTWNE